jgi:hypothetical protein
VGDFEGGNQYAPTTGTNISSPARRAWEQQRLQGPRDQRVHVPNQTAPTGPLAPPPNPLDPAMAARNSLIDGLLGGAQGRVAPQAAGATLGPLERAQMASLSPLQRAEAARLGAAATGTAARLGPAATAGGVSISGATATAAELAAAERATAATIDPLERAQMAALSPLERAQDSAFRAQQQEAANFLGGLMRGDNSVAAIQAKRQGDMLMRQQLAMAAGARPGQGASAQRMAAQNQARLGADLAGRTLEAQLAERNAAASQYANITGQARGQDLSLAQFNAGAANQYGQFQAGLQQQTNLANAAAFNQRAATQAGFQQQASLQNAAEANRQAQVGAQLGTQANIASAQNQTSASIAAGQANANIGIANAQSQNQMSLAQAQMGQQMSLANMGAENQRAFEQANLAQQASQFNAAQGNSFNLTAAQMAQQNAQFNAGAANTFSLEQARMAQQAGQFNVGAQLQQQGMNDAFTSNLLGQQLGTMSLQQQGQLSQAQMAQQLLMQGNQIEANRILAQMGIDASQANQPGFWDKLFSGIVGAGTAALPALIAASDERLKADVRQLRGVSWTWRDAAAALGKAAGARDAGVIAQEVEAVAPELVTEIGGVKHVNYTGLVGLVVATMQDLAIENEELRARVAQLEAAT